MRKDDFERFSEVLRWSAENDHSDFYKKKYRKAGFDHREIDSSDKLERVPILSKNDILAVPLKERVFVPNENVLYYSWSSGTTDPAKPMIVPHTDKGSIRTAEASRVWSKDLGLKRILFLRMALDPGLMKLSYVSNNFGATVIPGNMGNLGLSAKMASEIGIDAIFTTPTTLDFFIEDLQRESFDLDSIKLISLRGEICAKRRFEYFSRKFPNAEIDIKYGGSEIGEFIGYRCRHLLDSPPNTYHPSPNCFLETEEGSGNIIYTDLSPEKAFPLIRYRTEDVGSLERSDCPCGNGTLLKVKGRMGGDVTRLRGKTICFESIEDALEGFPLKPGRIRAVFRENGTALTVEAELEKEVEVSNGLKSDMAERIFRNIGLDDLSVNVEFLSDWPNKGPKSKNIVFKESDSL